MRLQLGATTTGCGYNWVRLQLGAATTGCDYNWVQSQLGAPTNGFWGCMRLLHLGATHTDAAQLGAATIQLGSIVDPDPVGSETFGRIRIRKNHFGSG